MRILLLDQYRTVRYDYIMNEQVKIIEAGCNAEIAAEQNPSARAQEVLSVRAQEVLSVVLDLMVEEGDGFSMASVAKRASCSKETLYRWFGDRDGLLTATVKWQASKVIMPKLNAEGLTKTSFCKILEEFAQSWLTVITGEVSIALNRLAVSHAGNNSSLGKIVLTNGPFAMRERLEPIFTLGKQAGLIEVNPDKAFTNFFGLVVSHHQIRALLGDEEQLSDKQIQQFAKAAVENFMTLSAK